MVHRNRPGAGPRPDRNADNHSARGQRVPSHPGLVARLERRIAETDATFVGVDRLVHPGQMLDRRCQRLQADLETRRSDARERVYAAYGGVDAHVTLVGPPAEETTAIWEGLTGQSAPGGGPFSPTQPVSAVTNAGPHKLAVTDTPGLLDGLPAWYTDAVPGTQAALSRADVVVVVGGTAVSIAELSRAVDERFDATVVPAPRSGHASLPWCRIRATGASFPRGVRRRPAGPRPRRV